MLKKLFFLIIVCVGAYTLFQSSKLVATVIEKRMLNYSFDTKLERVPERQVSQFARLGFDSSILLSPLFSIYESVPDVSSDGDEEVAITRSPLLKKFELTGVILLGGNKSMAFIRKAGERESKVYRIGDKLENAEITKIERDRIYVHDGTKTIVIPMWYKYMEKSLVKDDTPVRNTPATDDKYTASKQVKKVMSRSEVENKVFQRVNQILTQVAISPYMVNGQMEGLRLMRVPNDNIVYELGGRSGDIVRRVNGHEVNQIDQMYKLWENIKDDSFISVDLERNNQIYNYSFEIRE
jgi:type II secretion system protein C